MQVTLSVTTPVVAYITLLMNFRITITSDKDIKHDLEVDYSPPIDLLHEYVNEYVIELDCEDDLSFDMKEDEYPSHTSRS